MLKKSFAFLLAAVLAFGGITAVAAEPQPLEDVPVQMTEERNEQPESESTQPDFGNEGMEDGTEENGNVQSDNGNENQGESQGIQQSRSGLATQNENFPENAGAVLNAKTTYYAGYQVRLDGNLDTEGDLAGLTFSLYEKTPGGEWNSVASKQSQYSSYYRLSYVYFTYFQLEGSPVNEYKVVMADNAAYEMSETTVQLDSNSLAQYGSTIEGNYLNLTVKEVPKDNTDIMVSLGTPVWGGTGIAGDPYTWDVTVDRFTDKLTVKTADSQAVILWNGNSCTGKLTEDLPYGESLWEFSVKSSDGTKESFYKINVTREKYTPLPPNGLEAVSPSAQGGKDGKIQGLDTSKLYEYRSATEMTSGIGYHPVQPGATEISGLEAGTYYVRFQETWEYAPSKDKKIVIADPVLHKISLPAENIPAGVVVLECPETMVEGREFTLRFRIPQNRLLEKVSYTRKAGSVTVSSSLSKNDFEYTQDGETTIVTISHMAFTGDTTLKISLLEGNYYQIQTFSPNGQTGDERGGIVLSGDESIQGGIHYFKEGTITATVNVSQDWTGYAKITGLKAVRRGTEEEIPGSLTKDSDDKWILEMNLDDNADIYYDFQSYPADFTALNQVVEKIGSLEQYVDNSALDTVKERLKLLSAYQKLPLKDQAMIDGYVTLLEEGYKALTLRQNLSEDDGVVITADEWEHEYDGNVWTPKITVSYKGSVLKENTDYRILYPQDMVSPGTKQITVEFLGNYIGQRTVTVSIVRHDTGSETGDNTGGSSGATSSKLQPASVKTGDSSQPMLYMTGTLFSLVVLCGIFCIRRKMK